MCHFPCSPAVSRMSKPFISLRSLGCTWAHVTDSLVCIIITQNYLLLTTESISLLSNHNYLCKKQLNTDKSKHTFFDAPHLRCLEREVKHWATWKIKYINKRFRRSDSDRAPKWGTAASSLWEQVWCCGSSCTSTYGVYIWRVKWAGVVYNSSLFHISCSGVGEWVLESAGGLSEKGCQPSGLLWCASSGGLSTGRDVKESVSVWVFVCVCTSVFMCGWCWMFSCGCVRLMPSKHGLVCQDWPSCCLTHWPEKWLESASK